MKGTRRWITQDEADYIWLLERCRNYSAARRNTPPDDQAERRREAVREILSDGQWRRKYEVYEYAKRKGLPITGSNIVIAFEDCAESDSGLYVCIPDDRTPEYAPDEERE